MRRCRVPLAAILSLTACSGGSSRGPLAIGLAGPLSQPRGASMQRAADLAVQEINARGGIRGRPLGLRIAADSARPEVATRSAQPVLGDPAVGGGVGPLTSGGSRAAGRVYGEARRPLAMISPSASSPDL